MDLLVLVALQPHSQSQLEGKKNGKWDLGHGRQKTECEGRGEKISLTRVVFMDSITKIFSSLLFHIVLQVCKQKSCKKEERENVQSKI